MGRLKRTLSGVLSESAQWLESLAKRPRTSGKLDDTMKEVIPFATPLKKQAQRRPALMPTLQLQYELAELRVFGTISTLYPPS